MANSVLMEAMIKVQDIMDSLPNDFCNDKTIQKMILAKPEALMLVLSIGTNMSMVLGSINRLMEISNDSSNVPSA